jgi:hypothetical protein
MPLPVRFSEGRASRLLGIELSLTNHPRVGKMEEWVRVCGDALHWEIRPLGIVLTRTHSILAHIKFQ